ncbi:MAG: hypothetical protein WD512_13625 [Candidatus Paceibacterota bacterium]
MYIKPEDISTALNTTSYEGFKDNLIKMGYKIPKGTIKFPFGLNKSWRRKLRYELRARNIITDNPTNYDLRQADYYNRLEKLGHPQPEMVMR